MSIQIDTCPSPIGDVRFLWRHDEKAGEVALALGFADGWDRFGPAQLARFDPSDFSPKADGSSRLLRRALRAYFDGDVRALELLAAETGGTPFQRKVWAGLRTIAPGRTLSYGALAKQLKRPGAARAVGAANGANPVSLIIPCHRVIASGGGLGGYGWNLERKEWLLVHEGAFTGAPALPL